MSSPVLPASVRVIVRDWLSANNIVLLQPGGNVLVDTSYVSRADETLQRLRDPNVLKVMLTFSVMARGRLPRSTLAAYLDDIPIYREYNALYFNVSSGALADLLVEALARTGALRVSGAFLVPGNATG